MSMMELLGLERYSIQTIFHSEVPPGSVNIGNILFANATNLTCERADWYDKRESLWKNATLYRDQHGKLAQDLGEKILDAMETFNRNPQPYHGWDRGVAIIRRNRHLSSDPQS